MSDIRERGFTPLPETTDYKTKGLRKLSEIERPYGARIDLSLNEDAFLIDNKLIFALRSYRSKEIERSINTDVFVAREKTLPIIPSRDGLEVCYPYQDKEQRRGEFAVLFIGLRPKKPSWYIGEQYRMDLIEREQDRILFRLNSENPIKSPRVINGGSDYSAILKYLYEREKELKK
jgi:hypothetical protein